MYVKSKAIIFQLIITLAFLFSCECPPNLDTNKEIIPTEFSNIAIINLIPGNNPFDVYSQKIPIASNIDCISITDINYYKFPANYANLMLKQNGSIIFNTMIYSLPSHYLTIFFYTQKQITQYTMIEDNYSDTLTNAYLRLCNFTDDLKLKYEISSSLPQQIVVLININDISKIIPMPTGKISVKVFDLESNNQISSISDISLNTNNITNIISTGNSTNNLTQIKRTRKLK